MFRRWRDGAVAVRRKELVRLLGVEDGRSERRECMPLMSVFDSPSLHRSSLVLLQKYMDVPVKEIYRNLINCLKSMAELRIMIMKLLLAIANLEVYINGAINTIVVQSSLFGKRNRQIVEFFRLQICIGSDFGEISIDQFADEH